MSSSWWAVALNERLSQGDVLQEAATAVLTAPPVFLRHHTLSKGKDGWAQSDSPVPRDNRIPMLASGSLSAVIVLSHGCEIDKKQSRVIVAPVKALSTIAPEVAGKILDGKVLALAPLPGLPGLGDYYADFRSTQALERKAVESCVRVASMVPEAIRLLQGRLVGFFARLALPDDLQEAEE